MSGTKISQLPAAVTPSATDLFPLVQSDVGPITRAITLAALRLAIFTNNTQPTFGLVNTSSASNETAGFTIDIGGSRKANITTQRIGSTSEGKVAVSVADTGGTLQEIISVTLAALVANRPVDVQVDATSLGLKLRGKVTSNDAQIMFTANNGTEQARLTASPDLLALRVGANTVMNLTSTGVTMLTPLTLAGAPSSNLQPTTKLYVDSAYALKANLAGPAFTGNPTATTQAVDTNNTRLATTAFVVGQKGTAAPLKDGTAAAGTSLRYASQDHVHPTSIPSGTVMLFGQTSAPTGWTKDLTHDNKALRVVSGTAGSGGTVDFTTAFASQAVNGTVGNTTLTTAQIPAHAHSGSMTYGAPGVAAGGNGWYVGTSGLVDTGSQGGGGAHDHTFTGTAINMAVRYVDVILASRD